MSFTPQVTPLNVQKQGANNFPSVAQWNDAIVLAANTASSYSLTTLLTNSGIKTKKVFLVFASDAPFWANFHATAVIPTGALVDGSAPEFLPNQRYVDTDDVNNPITAISFIATQITRIAIQVFMP